MKPVFLQESRPFFSFLMPTFNSQEFIEDALNSLMRQTYHQFEVIIQDAGSSDATLSILKTYNDKRIRIFSEKDSGIYDALNKGIEKSIGKYVGILHSDDILRDEHTLERLADTIELSKSDFIYCDLVYVDRADVSKVHRIWKAGKFTSDKLRWGWMPPHPTTLVKREVFDRYGRYNPQFKICGDYDFMVRILSQSELTVTYHPDVVTLMRTGGTSNNSILPALIKFREDLVVARDNKIGGVVTVACKKLRKFTHFLNQH